MKITAKIFLFCLLGVTNLIAQDLASFKGAWPKGYVLSDVNDRVGPGIVADFDGDGVKDVACLLYEKKMVHLSFLYISLVNSNIKILRLGLYDA